MLGAPILTSAMSRDSRHVAAQAQTRNDKGSRSQGDQGIGVDSRRMSPQAPFQPDRRAEAQRQQELQGFPGNQIRTKLHALHPPWFLMRVLSKYTRQILAQNAGRDLDRLTLKLALLRKDPFAFFRGTNPLFLEFLPRGHALLRAPCVLICGDLHLENFGAFKGDNRLCYFDMNDFDEACLAPVTLDIVRFVASIKVAAHGLGVKPAHSRLLVRHFFKAYLHSISDGKPRWVERSLAQGVFRELLRRAMNRTRRQLLARFTKLKGGERRIRADGVRALRIDAAERPRLKRLLAKFAVPGVGRPFFRLLDAARRIAGCGSLGLARYILLVQGRGSPDQNFALDLKFAAPSAVAEWLAQPQPQWASEAARVVSIQRVMQAISPALLHAVRFENQYYVLKELQPSIDRLDLSQWRSKPRRILQAVEGMGHVAAWAHLRGCGHYGAASSETLQAYAATKRWPRSVDRLASVAARRIHRAWEIYCRDFDSGAVTAALAKIKPR